MSIAFEDASTPEAFCAALKRARERSGISLSSISDSTKIAESHLAALERGDLRHWPKGIFRRAFFRDYAKAIGIAPDHFEQFRRLFPEDGAAPTPAPMSGQASRLTNRDEVSDTGLRLVLADEDDSPRLPAWRRAVVALLDAVMMFALAMKVRVGAPRALPQVEGSAPAPDQAAHQQPPAEWVTDARRLPDAHPQMRVRMRVVR